MKKIILLFTIGIGLVSCKMEKTEKESLNELSQLVNTLSIKDTIFKDSIRYNEEIIPLINDLYLIDSVKYNIIKNISIKIPKKNNKIYAFQINDLAKELEFLEKNITKKTSN